MQRLESRFKSRSRHGLSMVEVMISLTISTFLLVAVAAAYNASADAVEMNDRFFRATQAGRVTMNQLVTEIRRADSVSVTTNTIKVIRPAPSRIANEKERWYQYDPVAKQMTLQIYFLDSSGLPPTAKYSLARNVEAALFGPPETQPDPVSGLPVVTRVPVQLVVKIGNNEVRLSGASGPRRAAKE